MEEERKFRWQESCRDCEETAIVNVFSPQETEEKKRNIFLCLSCHEKRCREGDLSLVRRN